MISSEVELNIRQKNKFSINNITIDNVEIILYMYRVIFFLVLEK